MKKLRSSFVILISESTNHESEIENNLLRPGHFVDDIGSFGVCDVNDVERVSARLRSRLHLEHALGLFQL